MSGPLKGVRVLDLTGVVSGPFATMFLADQGADVLKIEPIGGDITRRSRATIDKAGEFSALFISSNRGKRSLSIDVKSAVGREVLARLVAQADVLVQNFRPGAMERLGLGADELRERNSSAPRPRRSMAPGRKFCTSTSACATSLARTSRPTSLLMSIDSERLPRFEEMNRAENSPALSMVARLRRVMSPPIGSILSTSAPWSARNMVANGPDTTPVKSSTRTPLSGPDMTLPLCCLAGGRPVQAILDRTAVVCSTIDSSTSRS